MLPVDPHTCWKQITMRKYIDKEEMELAKSLEAEEWVTDLTKKEKKQYEEYARMMHRGRRLCSTIPESTGYNEKRGRPGSFHDYPGLSSDSIRDSLILAQVYSGFAG